MTLIGLGALFVAVGLDAADKISSSLGAFTGLAGLVLTGYGVVLARNPPPPRSPLHSLLRVVAPGGRLPRAAEVNPYWIGVAKSHYAPNASALGYDLRTDRRDPYIPRGRADAELDAKIAASRAGHGRPVLVIGPSKAGKSRTAWEAVRRLRPAAVLLAPQRGRLAALADWEPPPSPGSGPVVLWLDDLEQYLSREPLTDQLIRQLRQDCPDLVVIATMTVRQLHDLMDADPSETDADARTVLEYADRVHLGAELTSDEREFARSRYPEMDFLRGPGEELVAAWAHDELYETCPAAYPEEWAVIRAVIDWRRAGVNRPLPASALFRLAALHLPPDPAGPPGPDGLGRGPDSHGQGPGDLGPGPGGLGDGPMRRALAWAEEHPVRSPEKALKKVTEGSGEPAYVVFDYLLELADGRGGADVLPIPPETWAMIVEIAAPEDLLGVIRSARRRETRPEVIARATERLRSLRPGDLLPVGPLSAGLARKLGSYLHALASHPDLPTIDGDPIDLPVRRRPDLDLRIGLESPAEVTSPGRLRALDAIRELRRCVVVGEPGSGKTTTLKALANAFAGEFEECLDQRMVREHHFLPVYVWLPRFTATSGTPAERVDAVIGAALRRLVADFDGEDLKTLLNRCALALLFDGLNEMGAANMTLFLDGLSEFVRSHERHLVVVASRTYGFESASRTPGFETRFDGHPFQVLQLLELEYPDGVRDYLSGQLDPLDVHEVMAELERNAPLRRLALNPLLLRLITTVHLRTGRLPDSRAKLLQAISRELLGRLERPVASLSPGAAGTRVRYGAEHCHALLGALGYAMRREGLELPSERVAEIFRAAEANLRPPPHEGSAHPTPPGAAHPPYAPPAATARAVTARSSSSRRAHPSIDMTRLIDELVRTRLLLRDSGTGRIRFWHQTIQEYFAACHMSEEVRRRIGGRRSLRRCLRCHLRDPAWREIIAMVAGLLTEAQAVVLIHRLPRGDRLLAAMCLSNTPHGRMTELKRAASARLWPRIKWYGVIWQRAYPYLLVAAVGAGLWLVPPSVIEFVPAETAAAFGLAPAARRTAEITLILLGGIAALIAFFRLYARALMFLERFAVHRVLQPGITSLRLIDDAQATGLLTHLRSTMADDFSVGNLTRATIINHLLPRTHNMRELELQLRSDETRLRAIGHLAELATPASVGLLRDLLEDPRIDDLSYSSALRELVRHAKAGPSDDPARDELERLLRAQLTDDPVAFDRRRQAYLALRELGADATPPRKGRWRAMLTATSATVLALGLALALIYVVYYRAVGWAP